MNKTLKKIFKGVTKNFWVKLFCLIAASVLWVYVAAGQNSVGKFPGDVEIKAVNVPAGLVAVYNDKKVQIKIMADSSTWRKLSADTFSAYVDMSAYSAGTYELPVNISSSISGVQIVEKTPASIFVTLEPIVQKEVLIDKKIEGSAADGFVAGDVTFDPPKVTVTGPKSVIDNLNSVTAEIKLNGESANFSKALPLAAYNNVGDQITNISFLPSTVTANVAIIKGSNSKTVGIRASIIGQPADGYYVSSVSVTPQTVDIAGDINSLSNINSISTSSIDVSGILANLDRDVSLSVPSGIVLTKNSATKVHVKVSVSASEVSREITATISPRSLVGYSIIAYNPNQVKVVVSGSADLIASLKTTDITLPLDFSTKTLGNIVNFDVSASNLLVPTGISVTSVTPSTLAVTLNKAP